MNHISPRNKYRLFNIGYLVKEIKNKKGKYYYENGICKNAWIGK